MNRPEPGTITERELVVPVCSLCGYAVADCNMCSYECSADGEPRTSANTFQAIYKRVDTFLRDEPFPDAEEPATASLQAE